MYLLLSFTSTYTCDFAIGLCSLYMDDPKFLAKDHYRYSETISSVNSYYDKNNTNFLYSPETPNVGVVRNSNPGPATYKTSVWTYRAVDLVITLWRLGVSMQSPARSPIPVVARRHSWNTEVHFLNKTRWLLTLVITPFQKVC